MFVRFECGCLGISGHSSRGETYPPTRLVDCRSGSDPDDDVHAAFVPSLAEKRPYVALTPAEVESIYQRLNSLISDGLRFREVKRLLA